MWKRRAALVLVLVLAAVVAVVLPAALRIWYFAPSPLFYVWEGTPKTGSVAFGERIPVSSLSTLSKATLSQVTEATLRIDTDSLPAIKYYTYDGNGYKERVGPLPTVGDADRSLLKRASEIPACVPRLSNANQVNAYTALVTGFKDGEIAARIDTRYHATPFGKKCGGGEEGDGPLCGTGGTDGSPAHPSFQCLLQDGECCAEYGRFQIDASTCAPVQPI